MSLRRSLAWAYFAQFASILVAFIGSVIVARLLTPHELGIFAIAMAASGVIAIFAQFGIGSYVVREMALDNGKMNTAFTMNAALSVLLSLLLVLTSFLGSAPRIIDCGANYGVSVRYFKLLYPDCQITAVEADPRIFAMLEANVEAAKLEGVKLLHRAVADVAGPVTFYSEGADAGRIHELEVGSKTETVEGITLDELIDTPVDFLKIDIEGAETTVLRSCSKLASVDQIFVEYHSFSNDRQSLDELLTILREHGFRYYIHTQLCSPQPLTLVQEHMGMDMQLNIFAKRTPIGGA